MGVTKFAEIPLSWTIGGVAVAGGVEVVSAA
jgi:hypothetical protein